MSSLTLREAGTCQPNLVTNNDCRYGDFTIYGQIYPADALRNVAIDGQTLWSQWADILGLAAWLAVTFLVAVLLFRWE